jgi:hypothetical protein
MSDNKPIPYALSQYGSCTEVLYKCASCGADFRILGHHELYCHRCGAEQYWSDSPSYCSQEFKQQYGNLVYERNAFLRGEREQDKELVKLMYSFYKGEFR